MNIVEKQYTKAPVAPLVAPKTAAKRTKKEHIICFTNCFSKAQLTGQPLWKTHDVSVPFACRSQPKNRNWTKLDNAAAIKIVQKKLKYLPLSFYPKMSAALVKAGEREKAWYRKFISAIWHRIWGDGKWLSTATRATLLAQQINDRFAEKSQKPSATATEKITETPQNATEPASPIVEPANEKNRDDLKDNNDSDKSVEDPIVPAPIDTPTDEPQLGDYSQSILYLKGTADYLSKNQSIGGKIVRDVRERCGEVVAGLFGIIIQHLPITAWKETSPGSSRYQMLLQDNKERAMTIPGGGVINPDLAISSPCFIAFEGSKEQPTIKIEGIKIKAFARIPLSSIVYDPKTHTIQVTRLDFIGTNPVYYSLRLKGELSKDEKSLPLTRKINLTKIKQEKFEALESLPWR